MSRRIGKSHDLRGQKSEIKAEQVFLREVDICGSVGCLFNVQWRIRRGSQYLPASHSACRSTNCTKRLSIMATVAHKPSIGGMNYTRRGSTVGAPVVDGGMSTSIAGAR